MNNVDTFHILKKIILVFLRLVCCLGYHDSGKRGKCPLVDFLKSCSPLQQPHVNALQQTTFYQILVDKNNFKRYFSIFSNSPEQVSGSFIEYHMYNHIKPSLWLFKGFTEVLIYKHKQKAAFMKMSKDLF